MNIDVLEDMDKSDVDGRHFGSKSRLVVITIHWAGWLLPEIVILLKLMGLQAGWLTDTMKKLAPTTCSIVNFLTDARMAAERN